MGWSFENIGRLIVVPFVLLVVVLWEAPSIKEIKRIWGVLNSWALEGVG